ncbi:MAG: amidohydrolase family protein [Ruminococcus sp.]|nr:amidohydrolase family protein [Ruminococcus sp.]
MIIDTHAHIGHMLNFNMTEDDLLYSVEKYNIDFTLLSNIECAEFDHKGRKVPKLLQKSQNKVFTKTLSFVKKHPDKLGLLVWLKIGSELPDERFINMLKENREYIYGFKFHPFHSKTAPDDKRLEPIYRLAEEYKLPAVSHTGGNEQAKSIHLYNAAKAHPEIDFVMVHMDLGTDNKEALDLLGKLPNLYGDTTWVPIETTIEAIKRYGSGKMLFGSDNPIDGRDTFLHNKTGDRSLYQKYFNELRDMISKEDYENLMYKNAQRIFSVGSRK